MNGLTDPEEIYDTKEAAVTAVALDRYPSPPARDLNLVTKGKPASLTQALVTWILTDGQQYLAEMGYVALPQDRLNEEQSKLGH
jgi:phosphate transport system substrate-binding protein